MILTCPQCAIRYQVDEANFPPSGRMVRCFKCRLVWHQPGLFAAPEPVAVAIEPLVAKAEMSGAANPSSAALAQPTTEAAPGQSPLRAMAAEGPTVVSFAHFARAAGWAALTATVLFVALLAKHYREDIASLLPQSASLQSLLGHQSGKQGVDLKQAVDLKNVGYQRELDDGQTMLVLSGTIANSTDHELPVPKLIHVTLSDDSHHELFYTAFPLNLATLGPGQSVIFSTRIHDVPSANLHLQMRFDAS
jgi:predicted Zn finger-like uncharacterized protein